VLDHISTCKLNLTELKLFSKLHYITPPGTIITLQSLSDQYSTSPLPLILGTTITVQFTAIQVGYTPSLAGSTITLEHISGNTLQFLYTLGTLILVNIIYALYPSSLAPHVHYSPVLVTTVRALNTSSQALFTLLSTSSQYPAMPVSCLSGTTITVGSVPSYYF
jgi:hypothetical protein